VFMYKNNKIPLQLTHKEREREQIKSGSEFVDDLVVSENS